MTFPRSKLDYVYNGGQLLAIALYFNAIHAHIPTAFQIDLIIPIRKVRTP